uniref:Uncharacterized protein n=1 Tax=Pipistrellus kuhlii TaxID=59472 RepID=A0A7J7UG65_PIPKU|nr:hypothetical protein mPipKuh1_009083 [Pipistrellus kuhlii]
MITAAPLHRAQAGSIPEQPASIYYQSINVMDSFLSVFCPFLSTSWQVPLKCLPAFDHRGGRASGCRSSPCTACTAARPRPRPRVGERPPDQPLHRKSLQKTTFQLSFPSCRMHSRPGGTESCPCWSCRTHLMAVS